MSYHSEKIAELRKELQELYDKQSQFAKSGGYGAAKALDRKIDQISDEIRKLDQGR